MGAYAYCEKCQNPFGEPTAREVIEGAKICPYCDETNQVRKTKDDLLIELVERVEELETKLKKKEKK